MKKKILCELLILLLLWAGLVYGGASTDKITLTTAPSASTDATRKSYVDGLVSPTFGDWASKSAETVYQAATDGFVVAYGNANNNGFLEVYSDSSNPPTTLRGKFGETVHDSGPNYSWTLVIPVRANDYYKVTGSGTYSYTAVNQGIRQSFPEVVQR